MKSSRTLHDLSGDLFLLIIIPYFHLSTVPVPVERRECAAKLLLKALKTSPSFVRIHLPETSDFR